DGAVSEAEFAEAEQNYTACLQDSGFSDIELGEQGARSYLPPAGLADADSEAADQACQDASGWGELLSLYWDPRLYPNHQDPVEETVACFVRLGLREEGYAVEDYWAEFEAGTLRGSLTPADPTWAAYVACNDDPVHAQPAQDVG
ncbi:MAG: hypothetical protein LBR19_03720, partial [Bifidobacteriaceae bacterium]|nr:hypothetical protein [Bifidobacteriaceae bacterium]